MPHTTNRLVSPSFFFTGASIGVSFQLIIPLPLSTVCGIFFQTSNFYILKKKSWIMPSFHLETNQEDSSLLVSVSGATKQEWKDRARGAGQKGEEGKHIVISSWWTRDWGCGVWGNSVWMSEMRAKERVSMGRQRQWKEESRLRWAREERGMI